MGVAACLDLEAAAVVRGTHGGRIVPGVAGWEAGRGVQGFGVDRVVNPEVGEGHFVAGCSSRGI
jgi:hypothetical protein